MGRGADSCGIYRIVLQAALCELAQDGNIVYHGRAGQEFFPGIRHVLNVFVDTPTESRIRQVMARKGLTEEAAGRYLEELDNIRRAGGTRELFKIDWRDPTRYDLVLNTAKTTVETAARMIAEVSQREEYRPTAESLQAVKDLTITARVEATLVVSRLEISNLEVETRAAARFTSAASSSRKASKISVAIGLERFLALPESLLISWSRRRRAIYMAMGARNQE